MTIGIYGTEFKEIYNDGIGDLIKKLQSEDVELLVYEPFLNFLNGRIDLKGLEDSFNSHEELAEKIDLLFSIGGDGTFLSTISLVRDSGIPVLGINTGRLGFLSTIAVPGIDDSIELILNKKYSLEPRSLVQIELNDNPFGEVNYALNEIAVTKKDSASLIVIHSEIDGEYLHGYWADGLLVATPTGSTAYSLSCSGPIVHPGTNSFVINPIAPHHLNVRPMIIPDDVTVRLWADGREDHFLVSLDSRSITVESNQELIIRKAPFEINLVKPHGHTFLSTMKNKLMWGIDKRN